MISGAVAAAARSPRGLDRTFMVMSLAAVTKQVMAQPNGVYTYTFDHSMLNAVNATVGLTYLSAPANYWTGP